MALSEARKAKLKELELTRGGVAFVSERSRVTPTPTIIISLGGLGGRTLNVLKGKFRSKIGESDHIYFRVIDTDKEDANNLLRYREDGTLSFSGNMEAEEIIELYDDAIAKLLAPANCPAYIRNWLNDELLGKKLDDKGAQQRRQIGRAMLANDTIYNNVRAKLQSIILDAIKKAGANGNVDVIVLAGISGGTGSGTIIDMTYMLHDIFSSVGNENYQISGYIYTPDAQFTEPKIAQNESLKLSLKQNGYAALKEIDYFMNIEETGSTYKLSLGTREVTSSKNIFRSCTLVSGYVSGGGMNPPAVTIGRLTDQLMDMLTDIEIRTDDGPAQMSSSIMCNADKMLSAWIQTHPDRKLYHRYASYKYQVLGYNSVVVPRDEILAYCVNRIYEAVIKEFKDFTRVNKEMMRQVYSNTNIISPDAFMSYAIGINSSNPINRMLISDGGYTKKEIKNNPMIAYWDARNMAESEKLKINAAYQAALENALFGALKKEIDKIFEKYGPYVALKAIEHKHDELGIGDPNEPFPGIIEMLKIQSDKFIERKNTALASYTAGGETNIKQAADRVRNSIKLNHSADIAAYVTVCCEQAVTDVIDPILFEKISNALHNVAVRMTEYNNELFDTYTRILTEVQNLLNKDGQYFAVGITKDNSFSVDIIKSGEEQTEKLQKYLDSFISNVSVQELANNFIKAMRDNKEKWLAQNSENNFDVVGEVRRLMDECLIKNQMKDDIIEKFVTVAYSPMDLTPSLLDSVWNDNTPDGTKMTALKTAAKQIYTELINGAQPMANSGGVIALSEFSQQAYVSSLTETPNLTELLNNIIDAHDGFRAANSNSKDKFIFTRQYMSLPMYILLGMNDYNQAYVDYPSAGRHMDEKGQNWGRFQNPYTIDSVALKLQSNERPAQDIEKYPDYQILMDVQRKAKDGIEKYGFVNIVRDGTGLCKLYLQDITSVPEDMVQFKADLYRAALNDNNLDIIAFMKDNGFVINPIEVLKGQMDVDFTVTSFDQANPNDMATCYKDIPVPVPDIYKWLRKSVKYIDILDKDTKIFEDIYDSVNRAEKNKKIMKRYSEAVETFAYAVRTGMVKQDENNEKFWKYENGSGVISVNLGKYKAFDRKYYLYHVFSSFYTLDDSRLKVFNEKAGKRIDNGEEIEYGFVKKHISDILSDRNLGDRSAIEDINKEAADQNVTEHYEITDRVEDKGNPYKILERFYKLLQSSM